MQNCYLICAKYWQVLLWGWLKYAAVDYIMTVFVECPQIANLYQIYVDGLQFFMLILDAELLF